MWYRADDVGDRVWPTTLQRAIFLLGISHAWCFQRATDDPGTGSNRYGPYRPAW